MKKLGVLKQKKLQYINNLRMSVGFECLDKKMFNKEIK
jgi:hypothetical protein